MKVNYQTTRETAVVLKEWAGNCGSGLDSLCNAGMASAARELAAQRKRSVESFMAGEVETDELSAESVLRALGPRARRIRKATIAKLAPTIKFATI